MGVGTFIEFDRNNLGPLPVLTSSTQLRGGDVDVQYAPILPFLTAPVRGNIRAQFKLPEGVTRDESAPRKTLGARKKKRVTPPTPFRPHTIEVVDDSIEMLLEEPVAEVASVVVAPLVIPEATPAFEPLVLWEAPEDMEGAGGPISVDPVVCKFLREHQREGLQFLFDCVHGLKPHGGHGCILADDMGLGKVCINRIWAWERCVLIGYGPGKGACFIGYGPGKGACL